LLIHGAGASSAIWMMVMARLARFTRAVAVDLPGHGPSPAPETTTAAPLLESYRDVCGELAALVGLGRSVLVGHSMGALVAIQAALAWPDKVAGLVLCNAAPRLTVSGELLDVLRSDHRQFAAWMAEHALSPAARPALRRGLVAAGSATSPAVTLADFEAISAADLAPRISELRCPMIWLDGADDRILGSLPDRPGQIKRLEGVGHLAPIEAPAAAAEAVSALAREL
jgi:pimeloyl-ACP methyl ester carboxylesterase